jgi:hypothetical protein
MGVVLAAENDLYFTYIIIFAENTNIMAVLPAP